MSKNRFQSVLENIRADKALFNATIDFVFKERDYTLLTKIIKGAKDLDLGHIAGLLNILIDQDQNKAVQNIIKALDPGCLDQLKNHKGLNAVENIPLVHRSVIFNNQDVLKFLIGKGFDPNVRHLYQEAKYQVTKTSMTALHPDVLKSLIGKGFDPNVRHLYQEAKYQVTKTSMTALQVGIEFEQKEAVDLMLQKPPAPDPGALSAAIKRGWIDVVSKLSLSKQDLANATKNSAAKVGRMIMTKSDYPQSLDSSKIVTLFLRASFEEDEGKATQSYVEAISCAKKILNRQLELCAQEDSSAAAKPLHNKASLKAIVLVIAKTLEITNCYTFPIDDELICLLQSSAVTSECHDVFSVFCNQISLKVLYKNYALVDYYIKKALEIESSNRVLLGEIYYNWAIATKCYDPEKALGYIMESKKYLDQDPDVLYEEYILQLNLENFKEAREVLKQMPEDAIRARYLLETQIYEKTISNQEAKKALEALNIEPSSYEYLSSLCCIEQASIEGDELPIEDLVARLDKMISIRSQSQAITIVPDILDIYIKREDYTGGLKYIQARDQKYPWFKEYCAPTIKYYEYIIYENTAQSDDATATLKEIEGLAKYGKLAARISDLAHQLRFYTAIEKGDFPAAESSLSLTRLDPALLESLKAKADSQRVESASLAATVEDPESDDDNSLVEFIRLDKPDRSASITPHLVCASAVATEASDSELVVEQYLSPQEIHAFCQERKRELAREDVYKNACSTNLQEPSWHIGDVTYQLKNIYPFREIGTATYYACIKDCLISDSRTKEKFVAILASKGEAGRAHGRSGVVIKNGIVKIKDQSKDVRPWTDKLYCVTIGETKHYLAIMDHLDDHASIARIMQKAQTVVVENIVLAQPTEASLDPRLSEEKDGVLPASCPQNLAIDPERSCLGLDSD